MANDLYSGVGIRQLVAPPERPAPYEPIKYLLDTLSAGRKLLAARKAKGIVSRNC